MNRNQIEEQEIELVIHAIAKRRGYDFNNYARPSLHRRLQRRLDASNYTNFSELISPIMHDDGFFGALLQDLSVTVTEMFRDPHFYKAFRTQVIPLLRTYPLLKIWHAGCATGQEPYSMAILLHEEGLLKRAQIYATDINEWSLAQAQRGIYPLEEMEKYVFNYEESGGKGALTDYYRTKYASASMAEFLREKILFSGHNLVTDGAFGEMHVIVCRNVLIYFDKKLQNEVLTLFQNSLIHRGILCLGDKESLRFSSVGASFEPVSDRERIFKKLASA